MWRVCGYLRGSNGWEIDFFAYLVRFGTSDFDIYVSTCRCVCSLLGLRVMACEVSCVCHFGSFEVPRDECPVCGYAADDDGCLSVLDVLPWVGALAYHSCWPDEVLTLAVELTSYADVYSAAADKLYPSLATFVGCHWCEISSVWPAVKSGNFDSLLSYWSDCGIVGSASPLVIWVMCDVH